MRKLPILSLLLGLCFMAVFGCTSIERGFLFFPSHHHRDNGLTEWKVQERIIGYARQVPTPENVWLMLHGNAGQAADRTYALASFSDRDSVFILEYPGYGTRPGKPSKRSFNAAAAQAYKALRDSFPKTPICVVGESIGTGPACMLANESPPPEKIVLIVPFDTLASVAADHFHFVPVSLILRSKWDNIRSLSAYKGSVEIFGALEDTVIPIEHASKLASSIPSAKFHRLPGGHNDWPTGGHVAIRNP